MALSRAGVVEYLKQHNLGLDSSGRFDVRIPKDEWESVLQSVLAGVDIPSPAKKILGDYERDTQPAASCKVLLLLETMSVPGRLEVELTMPAPPAVKMQIGRAGSVRVESVRYIPGELLYVCRCCLVRFGDLPDLSLRAAVEEFVKSDTGLEWEQHERK